ncbi:MAG: hypothetical protein OEW89_04275 [Gammaproteobacteria bacterium]|nr:hypothetical protein [Gammaproteobacteria bacterium]MDH5594296.1 hypothetical protein [Gammaproteobacteria bacterium]
MKNPVVVIGLGEMGGVFARGLLKSGHPVYPITRSMDMAKEADLMPEPELVLVAVAENDLHPVLEKIPTQWRNRLVLLQNELLPRDWQQHQLDNPTVVSVWFEKKKGQDAKVIIPSPVFGPHANQISEALGSIEIPTKVLSDAASLEFELVLKNVYILTTNIAGLETGGTVGDLWESHTQIARAVASDVMDLQESLTGNKYNRESLIQGMVNAFNGDLEHRCMGRSASARLERALKLAEETGLAVSRLKKIKQT